MPVRSIAAAVINFAFFRQRSLLGKIVVAAVKLGDIFCNCCTFGIDPRALADAVTRIFSAGTLGRQICVPGLWRPPRRAASCWQCRSAPARPPRSAPLPEPTLVTKNDIFACWACAGAKESRVRHATNGAQVRATVMFTNLRNWRGPTPRHREGQNPSALILFRNHARLMAKSAGAFTGVLRVGDRLQPGHVLAALGFLHGNMFHAVFGRRPVPVLFAWRNPHSVARTNIAYLVRPRFAPNQFQR